MSYSAALAFTLEQEKPYANHPKDKGKETVWGIARAYHPEWSGWPLVDAIKARGLTGKALAAAIAADPALTEAVNVFYYGTFWTPNDLDRLPGPVAVALFDSFVIGGDPGSGGKWAQRAVNRVYGRPHLLVDGDYGRKSKAAVAEIAAVPTLRGFYITSLLFFRELHHGMSDDAPTFINGWSKRVRDLSDYTAAMTPEG